MSFIEHRLGRTHFTAKGKTTDRLPVIWLHGGPGGTHNPNGNVFKLSENRKVYAYTQLGSGKSSDLSQRQWRISTFVQELQLLVAAWGLKDFHLMGGSWGTTLALEYYLKVASVSSSLCDRLTYWYTCDVLKLNKHLNRVIFYSRSTRAHHTL